MALVHRLPEAFSRNEGELLYDKRNQVRRFTLSDGSKLMVKQFHKPNIIQCLCYSTFWTNKAEKSFRFGIRLLQMGIDTPEPIASVVYKHFGLVKCYYFVSTEDLGADCKEVLKPEESTSLAEQAPMIDALAGFLAEIHERGFMHGDANLSNFRIHQTEAGYHFAVIDTNRSKFLSQAASYKQRIQNLSRISHERCLIEAIAQAYARQCGYAPPQTYQDILSAIERFEQHKARMGKLKKIFRLRH